MVHDVNRSLCDETTIAPSKDTNLTSAHARSGLCGVREIEIIAERGFEGLNVRWVGARAGLSVGAPRHHFPTKEAR